MVSISNRAAICGVGLVALMSSAIAGQFFPHVPLVHDEFSYLLAGDTFAHGRLANPTHPMWEHLETMHVLQRPSYASKYPPGQGLALAVGIVLADRPILGVWLSLALGCMAVTWMLAGWIERPWPLVGGLLVALHPQILQGWGNTCWGGALPMAGAALVWGSLPRLVDRPRAAPAALLGFGLGVLALTRPFEGALASLPVLVALALRLRRPGTWPGWSSLARRLLLPASLALLPVVAFLAIYNQGVTGDPLRLPYVEFQRQYEVVPVFTFLPLAAEPEYRHDVLRRFYTEFASEPWRTAREPGAFLRASLERLRVYGRFYAGSSLGTLLLLGVLIALSDPRVRFALLGIVFIALALAFETFALPHYSAPIAAAWILLLVSSLRAAWLWRGGSTPVRVFVVLLLAFALVEHSLAAEKAAQRRARSPVMARPEVIQTLKALGGRHLVVVRYSRNYNPHYEVVYNGADIDGADVVWAREMDAARNARLLDYFSDRQVWLYRPGLDPRRLAPYPAGRPAPAASRSSE